MTKRRYTSHCIIVVIFLLTTISLNVKAQNDIKVIRERIFKEIMKPEVDDEKVAKLVKTIREDGTWPGINYDDVSRTGFEHRIHYENMVTLARAYKSKSSDFYKKKDVKKKIELALKNWADNDYICENWWFNQVGTPHNLVTLMLIAGDDLDKELVKKVQPIIGRANIDAPGARPGGDRIKIAGIQAKNILFLGDDETFEKIIKVIENEIKYVEWIGMEYGYGYKKYITGFANRNPVGRGIQYDNSFHHRADGVNNTLSYGLDYADAFIDWAYYTSGTKYSFTSEKLNKLIDYYLDGICKTAVFGKYPDAGAKNRSISRPGSLRPFSATSAEKLLFTSDHRKKEIQEIVDIRNKGIKPSTSHATYFWDSEHFTFQRPDFFTSVRLYSTRVYNMEDPFNREGILNHHRGDGVNHISITGDEYYDIWPFYDYQKIPGTTVMQKPELTSEDEIKKLGLTEFVGAATNGKYAAVAFDFISPHDPLIARKSWFFFDEEYVCLGSGISCKEELPVVTTLNQCLLRDDVTVSTENKKSVIEKGEGVYKNVDWVYQDRVGYVFPKPTLVNIKNNETTGSWWRISKQTSSSKEELKADVFMLWVDHGIRSSDEAYEYIVVPATSIEKLEQNTSKNNIEILQNTPEIQAVKHKGLDMCQAIFYKAGEVQVSDNILLASHTPGIVLMKIENEKIVEITVSDPNRELGKMNFSISAKITSKGENFKADWDENKNITDIVIDLPKDVYAGESVTINL